jgi:hypothetical protein
MVPLKIHHLPLSLEEGPHHLEVPQVLEAASQSSSPALQPLSKAQSTTPPELPHTTP